MKEVHYDALRVQVIKFICKVLDGGVAIFSLIDTYMYNSLNLKSV